jgi:hypothetical protein
MGRKNALCKGIMTISGNGSLNLWLIGIAPREGMDITQVDDHQMRGSFLYVVA